MSQKMFMLFSLLNIVVNPIKAGVFESKFSLGGAYYKALENRYRVEMHVQIPIFQGQLIEENN